MKRAYTIGGQTVTLKSTVHTWFVYKAQFGRELPEDMRRAIKLQELRSEESDEVKSAALLGEEYRLFLQLLWAFADEGTEGLPPFEAWLRTIDGVDIADVVKTVAELYTSTMKPDRRNRAINGGEDDGGMITTEEMAASLLGIGVTVADMKELTVGQAVNLIHAHIRAVKAAHGEEIPDPEKQYRTAKEIVTMIDSGEITDYDKQDYERLKKAVRAWENG